MVIDPLLIQHAREVLLSNRRTGDYHGFLYQYTAPSKGWYDQQWLWDSCYSAIALSTFDLDGAKAEMHTLLAGQLENGFIPNVLMWYNPKSIYDRLFSLFLFNRLQSRITQPPMIPLALESISNRSADRKFLEAILPKTKKYFTWLDQARTSETDPLVYVMHPWETGTDASPAFDKILGIWGKNPGIVQLYIQYYRLLISYDMSGWEIKKIMKKHRFIVFSVLFNCIYALNLRSLARLSKLLDDEGEYTWWNKKADQVEQAIMQEMWDPSVGMFYDLDYTHKQIKESTIASIFPLVLPMLPQDMATRIIEEHLMDPREFWATYPIPSVPRNSKAYNPTSHQSVLWRGPTWINTNWFLIKALQAKGFSAQAHVLLERTYVMLMQSGFREYFNPETGQGLGRKHFSWSALILDLVDDPDIVGL